LALKHKIKRNHKPGSHSHKAKTPAEREIYDEKVKLTEPEGSTREQVPSKTSTLSTKSIYGSSENVGIHDRVPFKPPGISEGFLKWIGIFGGILAILGLLIGACIWITTLKIQVVFNEKQIGQLNTNLNEVDSKRESLSNRIIKLEQWKDIIGKDLIIINEDMKKAVSNEQIEIKLIELERRVLQEVKL
jgi:hypothetical protein